MGIEVRWRAAIRDTDEPFTEEIRSLLPSGWPEVPSNAQHVVETIAENWFASENDWIDLFGQDWCGAIEFRVSSPEHVKGNWLVHLDLRVRAKAEALSPEPDTSIPNM